MVKEIITFDNTIGAAFLGNVAAAILYGITCLQTFVYYKKQHNDRLFFKLIIYFLWLLDGVQLAFVTHSMYFYLIKNFNNPLSLLSPKWSILGQVYVTCVSDVIIRIIYARRVWKISHNLFIVLAIALLTLVTFSGGFAFACRALVLRTFANFSQISYIMYISLGSAVVADILVAGTLCISLSRSRTGFKNTDTIVNVLIMYAINSSLLTTVCCTACFITYAIWPDEFTFISIYFCLSKLFLNSLLAMLNGRKELQEKARGLSDAPANFSQASTPRTMDFATSFASKDVYALESIGGRSKPLVINVNRQVDIEEAL